jgi:hypothetical protein
MTIILDAPLDPVAAIDRSVNGLVVDGFGRARLGVFGSSRAAGFVPAGGMRNGVSFFGVRDGISPGGIVGILW